MSKKIGYVHSLAWKVFAVYPGTQLQAKPLSFALGMQVSPFLHWFAPKVPTAEKKVTFVSIPSSA